MIDLNPLNWLGDKAAQGLAEGWTAAMTALWSAGMWLMEAVFKIIDKFLTPDLGDPGLRGLYSATLWISFAVAVMIAFAQIGTAVVRGDGTSLGTLAVGVAKYGLVVTAWVTVCAGVIAASAGLTTGLLELLLGVDSFSGFTAGAGWPDKAGGAVASTVLGFMSLFLLLPAGFGYVIIMLVREAALLILAATMPISAAGSLGEGTKTWLWKAVRWFVAACFTAPLLALVLGIGVHIGRAAFPEDTGAAATGSVADSAAFVAATAQATDTGSQIGMALVGVVTFAIGCFCPMALFRLLAFVDPGTSSGASMRATLSANGGAKGLLTKRSSAEDGSGAASQTSSDGRSPGEDGAETHNANRFQTRTGAKFTPPGHLVGATMRSVGKVAATGTAMGVDVSNQAGVGGGGYYDTPPAPHGGRRGGTSHPPHVTPHHARHHDQDHHRNHGGSDGHDGPGGGRGGGGGESPPPPAGHGPAGKGLAGKGPTGKGPAGKGPGSSPPGGAAGGGLGDDAVLFT